MTRRRAAVTQADISPILRAAAKVGALGVEIAASADGMTVKIQLAGENSGEKLSAKVEKKRRELF